MSIFKCKMCGGDLEISEGVSVCQCEYCGTKQTVPKADNDKKLTLFGRANRLRAACEFDKAAGVYETIVADFPEEAEAYWGLVLCKYGIEYVDDPASGNKIPTCHRSSFESVMDDINFEQALENADAVARGVYRDEAKQIEELRKGIIEVSSKEEPYDIFICYKETDDKGERTIDSVIAQDVYTELVNNGYRVFFSRISLEDKLGAEYEPYIFAALNSAKIMLAFGTSYEYYNAVWVKNEWSRFLQLIAKGEKKTLIPCYKDIDAYDMPKEFAKLQAQDMGKVGAIQDLLRGIEKILGNKKQSTENNKQSIDMVNALIKRAHIHLEDGDWDKADDLCEQALNLDPENAEAYLGKLMAEVHVYHQEELKNCEQPFDDSNNYQRVLRFGDEKLEAEMRGYIAHINERNENARRAEIYDKAVNALNDADTEEYFKTLANDFESIKGYKDADSLAEQCLDKAEICRKDAIYSSARTEQIKNSIAGCESAIRIYESISGWKDADEQIYACRKKIEEIKAKEEADRLERERQAEQRRIAAEKAAKKRKKIAAIVSPIVVACIAFVIVLTTVIIPNQQYKEAVKRYGDLIKSASVGDTLKFGHYEQDDNSSNGKEEIEWLVLAKDGDRLLVVSKYALDCRAYNTSYTDATWETCSLRKWINGAFLKSAFNSGEQKLIQKTTVTADKNPSYSTSPGNNTTDKVFLLSINEVNKYFNSDSARECQGTAYCYAQGACKAGYDNCWWWLRSPGDDYNNAARVDSDGYVYHDGFNAYSTSVAVRPAMWISLE